MNDGDKPLRDDLNFRSDNVAGVSPAIMAALAGANRGSAPSYGEDAYSARLTARMAEVFAAPVTVFLVASGTAANSLALAAVTPPWGAIYCHREAHIEADECGAPGFFTQGAKLVLLDGADGKVSAATLATALADAGAGIEHRVQPAAVSLTQVSECGTLYRPAEIAAIADVCRAHRLVLHMDGARFANAVAALAVSPAEIANRAGVDVLSFGATKNGAMAAEALVFFRPELAENFRYRRKQAGQVLSKQRYLAAQFLAYLDDDLWLANARHANAMAARLAAGLLRLPAARLLHPVEANELFVALPAAVVAALEAAGAEFYRWGNGDDPARVAIRLVTAFDTAPAAVDRLIALAADYGGNGS